MADGGASAGGAARPAAGGRRPGQHGCTDASGCNGPRTVNQCRVTISQECVIFRSVLVSCFGHVSHLHRMCRWRISCYNRWNTRWDVHVIFIVVHVLNTLLVAYKHTYFVQRNRMKCGHSRNLFYVSRSYFSFYLHSFLTHLNKWNTRWDFIFIRHLKTTCGI